MHKIVDLEVVGSFPTGSAKICSHCGSGGALPPHAKWARSLKSGTCFASRLKQERYLSGPPHFVHSSSRRSKEMESCYIAESASLEAMKEHRGISRRYGEDPLDKPFKRSIGQPGRSLALGARCRGFKSLCSDHLLRNGLEIDPAWSHKPNEESAILSSATNLLRYNISTMIFDKYSRVSRMVRQRTVLVSSNERYAKRDECSNRSTRPLIRGLSAIASSSLAPGANFMRVSSNWLGREVFILKISGIVPRCPCHNPC